MSADQYELYPGSEISIAFMEHDVVTIDFTYQLDDVFNRVRVTKWAVAHATTSGKADFGILYMKTRIRKFCEVSRVVIMQMCDYDIFDVVRTDA